MTNEVVNYTKTVSNVTINKLENGFVCVIYYSINHGLIPDYAIESDEMKRWEMEQEHASYNNPPKSYVFSTYDSMMDFIKIQTGWE